MASYRTTFLLGFLFLFACEQQPNTLFESVSSRKTGIEFKNVLRQTEQFHVLTYGYFYNGGGVAAGDVNNDGLPDLYFTGNLVASHLYLNQGDLRFREVAKAAGVEAAGLWNTGVTMADVNADGWLDIYVCRSAAADPERRRNLLFINNGDAAGNNGIPTFSETAKAYGLDDPGYSTQAAFFDYDRDGDLDMYLLNHSVQEYAGFSRLLESYKTRKSPDFGDKLYRNDGGQFVDVSAQAGIIGNVLGFGLGLAVSDLNRDGWPDLYISNDYNEEDYLYINQQDGTFRESIRDYIDHVSLFSMGSDIADYNNDGLPDIMTLDMLPEDNYRQKLTSGPDNYDKYQQLINSGFHHQTMRNMLQLNNGDGTFSEIGQLAGVSNTDWSWAALFADFDNDGWKDLFISNGYEADYTNMDFMTYTVTEKMQADRQSKEVAVTDLLEKIPSVKVPNYMFKNQGDLTFQKVTAEWGLDQPLLSNGAAYADLDNDGDLDLVINNINEPASVFRNNAERLGENHFLKVKLKGKAGNGFGVGAEVCLYIDTDQYCQQLMPTRGFQSSVEPVLHFGVGRAATIDRITVNWPDGSRQQIAGIPVDQTLTVEQQAGMAETPSPEALTANLLFSSLDARELGIDFRHQENPYNDFKRETLLPHLLSRQGPCLALGDIDGDGLQDVFFGGAKGQSGQIYLQIADGHFRRSPMPALEADSGSEDTDALFFDADGDGDQDLYVVSGGNEFAPDEEALQDRIYLNDGKGQLVRAPERLPAMPVSGACVTAGDYDGDGDQDLFVGGRLTPGRYPVAPRSFLLQNDGNGHFADVTPSVAPLLESPGMVTDAAWTDYDYDGQTDLLLVGEWMPVSFFHNENGKLVPAPVALGLDAENAPPSADREKNPTNGWWNRIAPADLDGDGDTDYVLANFGWNAQIKASFNEPVSLYAKDFDNNGSIDPILAYYIDGVNYPAFSKDDMQTQIAGLKGRFIKYEDYAKVTIDELFSENDLAGAAVYRAYSLATSWAENKGDGTFELHTLPAVAQFAPMYGIVIEDFNADGRPDILLGGNFTGSRIKFGRYAGSKGALLLNDGAGGFIPSDNARTGLLLTGEVRDLAVIPLANGRRVLMIAGNNDKVQVEMLLEGKVQ